MKLFGTEITQKRIAFFAIFAVAALVLSQIKFDAILGVQNKNFTFFQLIGPTAAGVLGPFLGVASVLFVEISNSLITGASFDPLAIVLLLPMAFAALYFGSKDRLTAIPALVCMALFWMHPYGAQVWFYSLYWLIPVACAFHKDNIIARALGSTFTAHAIGSVAYLYAFNLAPAVWLSLIPVVAFERLTFAAGIVVSFYAINTAVDLITAKTGFKFANIEKHYSLAHGIA
ncbi:Uncharacterised protein [uncultured archaeon]|nr:Uncharacterised protein [uncultured archaeon]